MYASHIVSESYFFRMYTSMANNHQNQISVCLRTQTHYLLCEVLEEDTIDCSAAEVLFDMFQYTAARCSTALDLGSERSLFHLLLPLCLSSRQRQPMCCSEKHESSVYTSKGTPHCEVCYHWKQGDFVQFRQFCFSHQGFFAK